MILSAFNTLEILDKIGATVLQNVTDKHLDLISGLLIGVAITTVVNLVTGNRNLQKSYKLLLNEKDIRINEYKSIISERLEKVEIIEKDRDFFKRVRRYFRKNFNKKTK